MDLNQMQRQKVRGLVELAAVIKDHHRYTYDRRKELAEAIARQRKEIQERRRKLEHVAPYRGSDTGMTRQGYEDFLAGRQKEIDQAVDALNEMQSDLALFDARLEETAADRACAAALAERVLESAGLDGNDPSLTRPRFTGPPAGTSVSAEPNQDVRVSVRARALEGPSR